MNGPFTKVKQIAKGKMRFCYYSIGKLSQGKVIVEDLTEKHTETKMTNDFGNISEIDEGDILIIFICNNNW